MKKAVLEIIFLMCVFYVHGQQGTPPTGTGIDPRTQLKKGSTTKAQFLKTDTILGSPTAGQLMYVDFSEEVARILVQYKDIALGSGVPQNPKTKIYYDIVRGRMYFKRGADWFIQGEITQFSTPTDTSYLVGGVLTTVKYTDATWFNMNTQSRWNYSYQSGAWSNPIAITIDSLLSRNNLWTGKNTFQDSVSVAKGLKSGGVIDTKGLNTEGTALLPASISKGVQIDRDTVVASDWAFDGSFGSLGFDCSGGSRNGTMPNGNLTKDWIFVVRKEDDSVNPVILKNSAGVEFYRLNSKMSVTIKNKNGIWKRVM